jgi:hypothetical protein
VRRVLFPAGIVFKGSGWYATDSRKPAPSESATTTASGAEKSDATTAKADTKSDSAGAKSAKPETKSESAAGSKGRETTAASGAGT